jgi:hypothetical protein
LVVEPKLNFLEGAWSAILDPGGGLLSGCNCRHLEFVGRAWTLAFLVWGGDLGRVRGCHGRFYWFGIRMLVMGCAMGRARSSGESQIMTPLLHPSRNYRFEKSWRHEIGKVKKGIKGAQDACLLHRCRLREVHFRKELADTKWNSRGTNHPSPRLDQDERFLLTFFHHRHFPRTSLSPVLPGNPRRISDSERARAPPFPAFHQKPLAHSSFPRRPVNRIL